jgi:2-keto-3-deoxy-L-fuconate dehydrogenase
MMANDPKAPLFSLAGKTAVVTGGGSGIGEAIALLFARQGATVIVVDFAEEQAAKIESQIRASGGRALKVRCDVSDSSQVSAAFAAIAAEVGRIDILVNNAGIAHVGNIETTDEAAFDRVYQVNVRGTYLCARAVIPRMVAQGGGVILNMASIASLVGLEDRFAYSMSKGAVLSMTRSIAVDYMERGIRCNCICPARVHTPFVDGFLAKNYPGQEAQMFERLAKSQPLGRMGEPYEVAVLALYLCADESAFVTGQALPLDGGLLVK